MSSKPISQLCCLSHKIKLLGVGSNIWTFIWACALFHSCISSLNSKMKYDLAFSSKSSLFFVPCAAVAWFKGKHFSTVTISARYCPDCKTVLMFQLTISSSSQSIKCQAEALKEPVDDFKYSGGVFLPCLYSAGQLTRSPAEHNGCTVSPQSRERARPCDRSDRAFQHFLLRMWRLSIYH